MTFLTTVVVTVVEEEEEEEEDKPAEDKPVDLRERDRDRKLDGSSVWYRG